MRVNAYAMCNAWWCWSNYCLLCFNFYIIYYLPIPLFLYYRIYDNNLSYYYYLQLSNWYDWSLYAINLNSAIKEVKKKNNNTRLGSISTSKDEVQGGLGADEGGGNTERTEHGGGRVWMNKRKRKNGKDKKNDVQIFSLFFTLACETFVCITKILFSYYPSKFGTQCR